MFDIGIGLFLTEASRLQHSTEPSWSNGGPSAVSQEDAARPRFPSRIGNQAMHRSAAVREVVGQRGALPPACMPTYPS